jgi:hypothetical protein
MHRHAWTATFTLVLACGGHHAGNSPDAPLSNPDSGGNGADAPTPATYPRLVVAGSVGIQIWDHADAITAPRSPDATLGGIGNAVGLVVGDDNLYVATSGGTETTLYRYSHAAGLVDGMTPQSTISPMALGAGSSYHALMRYDSGGVWLIAGGAIHLVADAEHATAATAHFTHPWGQISSMVLSSGRLIGSQISGAGMLVWNNAATRTGTVAADWTLTTGMAGWNMQVSGPRLYVSRYSPPNISIWSNIANDSSPTAPDLSLTTVCGAGNSAELRYINVSSGDVLVVLHNELGPSGTTLSEKVCMFEHASALTGTPTPTAVAIDPMLVPTGSDADKAVLVGDRLFVLDRDGITIFDHALTTPARVTKLPISGVRDFVVLQ